MEESRGKVAPMRLGRFAGALVGVVAIGVSVAPVATADDLMGIYKVTDGKLKQSFDYIASSRTVHNASGGCWEWHHHSNGKGAWDLKPVAKADYKGGKSEVVRNVVIPVYDSGVFKLRGLGWTGPTSRTTTIDTQGPLHGPGYDQDCEEQGAPDLPDPDTSGCGMDSVPGYVTPKLVPYKGMIPILDNSSESHHRLGLFGEMPQPLGLYPCPSESTFASLFNGGRGDLSRSDVTLKAFESFKKNITLRGSFGYSGNQYFFFIGFEGGSGSQTASTKWSLELKCVRRC